MGTEVTSDRALLGVLALLAADRAERVPEARISTEALLHKSGFSNAQIGEIVGEKADTIRKRLERAEKDAKKGGTSK